VPSPTPRLPLFVRFDGQSVLVAGAGRVAARRIENLLEAGAHIVVIAPEANDTVRQAATSGAIDWRQRKAEPDDILGHRMVFALTNDGHANAELCDAARRAGVFSQRADAADDSDVFVPAVVRRGALQIAVSSDGAAPTLARLLRARLDAWLPRAYGDLAALAGDYREAVRQRLPQARRAAFWTRVLDGPIAEKVFAGRIDDARGDMDRALAGTEGVDMPPVGEVYLVGGGPGDPDLLTFRALRLMQRADVVLYDSLIAPAILDLVDADAERIHVGKRAAMHTLAQGDINALMVRLAREGKRVLRLKGGDPFVFGRGGEEIAELAESGVAFQVVPGITAASGCAAYAGIPLTHRDYAQSVTFVTGHLKAGELDLSWDRLARTGQTVVFFMALRSLPIICASLQAHGLPPDWPAALVIEGTTARQRLVVGTLADLADQAAAMTITGPTLLIVGEVVRLNEKLGWFRPTGDASA